MCPAKNRRLKTEIACPPENCWLRREIAGLLSDQKLLVYRHEPTVISVAAASQSRTETTLGDEYRRSITRSQGSSILIDQFKSLLDGAEDQFLLLFFRKILKR
jgi:hypothetical protein